MFRLYSAQTAETIIRRMDASIRRVSARYQIPAPVLRAILFQEITQIDLTTGEEFSGIIRGITPEGLLRIEAEGREKTFGFKEISYIF